MHKADSSGKWTTKADEERERSKGEYPQPFKICPTYRTRIRIRV